MLERFFRKQGTATDEPAPAASEREPAAWLKRLPRGRDRDTIQGAADLLEDLGEQHETLGLQAALQIALAIDAESRPAGDRLLLAYFTPHNECFGSFVLLESVADYLARLGAVYSDLIASIGPALPEDAREWVRQAGEAYLHAWGLHRRVARFRQRPAGRPSWQQANTVVCHYGAWKKLSQPDGTPSSLLRAYLNVLAEETVPWGSLTPAQMELAARLIARQPLLTWHSAPAPGDTHAIDLGDSVGPRRLPATSSASLAPPTQRRFSTLPLYQAAEAMLDAWDESDTLPEWLAGLPLERSQVRAALVTLAEHWGEEPPVRQSPREERYRPLLGAFGFTAARELREATRKVHAGGGEAASYEFVSEIHQHYDELAFGGTLEGHERQVKLARGPKPKEPELPRLQRLESEIPDLVTESWVAVDSSASGLGVQVPALLPRHHPGVLVALRGTEEVDWRVGIVRRVGRDPQEHPTLGIETLPDQCEAAVVHFRTSAALRKVAWRDAAEWVQAIVPDRSANELILPAGSFIFDMPVRILGDAWEATGRLREIRESGPDWERVIVVH